MKSQNRFEPLYNDYAPRLKEISRTERSLTFEIEETPLNGVCLSVNSFIRYEQDILRKLGDWVIIIDCQIEEGSLKVDDSKHIKSEYVLNHLEKDSNNFIFAIMANDTFDQKYTDIKGNKFLEILCSSGKSLDFLESLEDFKFHINQGSYNYLITPS